MHMASFQKVFRAITNSVSGVALAGLLSGPVYAELPVPCGSCAGGVWVTSGDATLSNIANGIQINQKTQQAILNWQSFNVGNGKLVDFKQPSSTAVALNRIFQSDPSRIFGTVTANGQIYLINQNGIVFGENARVNTQSLIASTLDVPDDVLNDIGLVNAVNQNRAALEGAGTNEKIEIAAGAEIRVARDGRAIIAAPEVINRGTIISEEGQTLLVGARDKVYLEASDDPDLRGLLVEVETGGTVTNLGEIIADGGNATLLGAAVNQSGRIRANSSVAKNGTIRLLARDDAVTIATSSPGVRTAQARRTGQLTVSSGSLTQVLADSGDGATASDAQSLATSKIEMMADDILIQSNSAVVAEGGRIEIAATQDPQAPFTTATANDASVTIESGAVIDVSGSTDAQVSAERNFVEVELRGNELRDNPVNRDGPVRGTTVVVDSRYGTEFADVSAFIEATERDASERLSKGGAIDIQSEGSIEIQQGADLLAKGGVVEYLPGRDTSSFLIKDGALTNIRDADPNILYDGVFGDIERDFTKWGVTDIFQVFGPADDAWSIGIELPGYLEGTDAGSISMIAPNIDLSGNIDLSVFRGEFQRAATTSGVIGFRPFNEMPLGGLLTLGGEQGVLRDFGLSDIAFGDGDDPNTLYLDEAIFADGRIPRLQLAANNSVLVPAGFSLSLAPGGGLSVTSGSVQIDGEVFVPGGSVELNAQPTASVSEGALNLGAGSVLDVSGVWVNDPLALAAGTSLAPTFLDGGSVSLTSDGDLIIPAGSEIRAWGGGQIDESGAIVAGTGGSIDIDVSAIERRLQLDGKLSAFALEQGGRLNVKAAGFAFGSPQSADSPFIGVDGDLLSDAGFSDVSLIGEISGINVAPGTILEVIQKNLVLADGFGNAETGTSIAEISAPDLLPLESRNPASLTLSYENAGLGTPAAEVFIGANAAINLDPGASLTLSADSRVIVDGRLSAPGGNVALRVARPGDEIGFDPTQKIWLGNNAEINVNGLVIPFLADNGLRDAKIVNAGSIFLEAQRGYVVGAGNALLSADAASGELDAIVRDPSSLVPVVESQSIYTTAGEIDLSSPEGIFYAGELSAAGTSDPASEGGTLRITLDNTIREAGDVVGLGLPLFPVTGDQIIVSDTRTIPFFNPQEAIPNTVNGTTILRSGFLNGNFDNLVLSAKSEGNALGLVNPGSFSSLIFDHGAKIDVANRLTIDVSEISVLNGHAELDASQLILGPIGQEFRYNPSSSLGSGRFSARADSVQIIGDVFFEDLAPTNSLNIRATNHLQLLGNSQATDVTSLEGSIRSAADISLAAPVIYPGTFSQFTIKNDRAGGAIRLTRVGNEAPAVFSVAGKLGLEADNIFQGGYVNVPFGELSFTGGTVNLLNNSVSSVAANNTVLFGATQFGLDWIYPLFGQTLLVNATPEKSVSINADTINVNSGASIDISGGGDLLAVEFRPGPGGSIDITSNVGNLDGSFAIIPSYGEQSLPFDPLITPDANIALGDAIQLTDNDLIPAGTYSVLPARFALLPGAFLLTPNSTGTSLVPGTTNIDTGGRPLIVGKRGAVGAGFSDALWSDFIVADGEAVRLRAEYAESLASTFFPANANNPADNGNLSLAATTALNLQGSVISSASGSAPTVDIVANKIDIVDNMADAAADAVAILANDLSNFSTGSVLLGATRQTSNGVTTLNVLSSDINVANNTSLSGVEFILAATDDITLGQGAEISGSGVINESDLNTLSVSGDAALLVVSQGQRNLQRDGVVGASGSITTAVGSSLSADGQVLLDVSGTADLNGALSSNGGEISIGASRISLGNAPGGTPGTILSGDALAQLSTANVRLRSASTLDLFATNALSFGSLAIDAESIVGHLGVGELLNITTDSLSLENTGSTGAANRGNGTLNVAADSLVLGSGTSTFDNFDNVAIRANNGVAWTQDSTLIAGGDLAISTSNFSTTAAGAGLVVDTPNGSVSVSRTTGELPEVAALGGRLSLAGDAVNFNTDVLLPSGVFTVNARNGDVNLAGAAIDVSGLSIDFVERNLVAPGGRVRLEGENVVLGNATIDVSAPSGQSGIVELFAANDVEFGATSIRALGGGGSVTIDADTLGASDAGATILALNSNGFNDEIRLGLGTQAISLAESSSLNARFVSLVSDTANVDLLGTIDVSGVKAGKIRAYSGNTLSVGDNAALLARALGDDEPGGQLELGSSGTVDVRTATIDVTGTGDFGQVLVRAPTIGSDVAVTDFAATVTGAEYVNVEAYQTFAGSALANANASIKPSLDSFAGNIGSIEMRLDGAGLPGVRVSLGAEVVGTGNLTVSNLDLINWRFGGNPGNLTVRTPGEITFTGTLIDGFEPEAFAVSVGLPARESAINGESSSFRFTAGADTASADPLSLDRATGSGIVFNNGARLITGTGDIEIASADDLHFLGDYVLHSAGRNRGSGVYGDTNREVLLYGDFLEDGGDVSLDIVGSLLADNQTGYITDFLARGALEIVAGSVGINELDIGTSWAISFPHIRQAIGAFGGGDMDIRVGGDMTGVSVYLPSTALPTGNIGSEPDVSGGSDLNLDVFGDITGGSFHLGSGEANIRTNGSFTQGPSNPLVLSLSDGVFNIVAQGDMSFDGVVDPFLTPRSALQGLPRPGETTPFQDPSYRAFFASFSENAAVNLTSVSGNITLTQDLDAFESLSSNVDFNSADQLAYQIAPPTLRASALSDSVLVGDTFSLYPSREGTLELYAKRNVQRLSGADFSSINLSDADLALLPNIATPQDDLTLTRQLVLNASSHAVQPVRAGNKDPTRIVALDGLVGSVDNADLIFDLGKRTRVFAGGGIRRLQLEAQHVNLGDVSEVFSGGDISYPLARSTSGALSDSQVSNMTVAGPGRFDVIAAGNIDLGTSGGLRTIGNTANTALEDGGATLNVLAGIGENPDYNAFAERFFGSSETRSRLVSYLDDLGIAPGADPLATYSNLTDTQKRQFAVDIFFDELIASGVFATSSGTDDYSRGNEAIATLFPGDTYNGDLISLVSRIQTVDGGDINILAPGGDIIAGSSSEGFANPPADRIGIVVQRDGDLNIFVRDDLLVEISRVFTLDGGDIAIWSAAGDIDAGRGAKSALSIPGLITTFDAEGNIVTEFPPAIQGSGIRAAVATPGRAPGDVFLFAPQGAVIAGDAGIGSAGNLTIGATEVVGADNIDVGGVSVGVPAADVGSVAAGLTGVADSGAAAANQAQDSAGDSLAGSDDAIGDALSEGALSFIRVEVLGFGG